MTSKKKFEQTTHLEVICLCFYYNANLTLNYLNSQQATDEVLKKWFGLLPKLKFDYQKVRSLLGMSCLLKVDVLPPSLMASLGIFMQKVVNLTTDLLELREYDEEQEEEDDFKKDLDDMDDALDLKGKNIVLGKFSNKDLESDD